MIALIDYGMGNLRSVQKAFEVCGAKPKITDKPADILRAERVVLPGVGAFAHAMRELRARKLIQPLVAKIASGSPYLGLCLGLQILFDESEEGGRVKGLGILPGKVRRFVGKLKIPQMGWNTVKIRDSKNPLLKGIPNNSYFYFVHSYYADPKDKKCVLATTPYGLDYCSAISKENIFATQFHPEKSQALGLAVIRNFLAI